MIGPWTEPPPANIITPYSVPLNATAEEHERAKAIRRAHPLFRDVNMRLLTEVINSRLFTTVLPCEAAMLSSHTCADLSMHMLIVEVSMCNLCTQVHKPLPSM